MTFPEAQWELGSFGPWELGRVGEVYLAHLSSSPEVGQSLFRILFREVFWEPCSSKVCFLNLQLEGFLPLILGVSRKDWGGEFFYR